MSVEANRILGSTLQQDDGFLTEVGRLTSLFTRVEGLLVESAKGFVRVIDTPELHAQAKSTKLLRLRFVDKLQLVRAIVVEVGRFYNVDPAPLLRLLDQLGGLNQLRRIVVHGSLVCDEDDSHPMFVDGRGNTTSAWLWDVLTINQQVLDWYAEYNNEQLRFASVILEQIDSFIRRHRDRFAWLN